MTQQRSSQSPMSLSFVPRTARELAFAVLSDTRPDHQFVADRLEAHAATARIEGSERGLATELVYEVTRRRGTLDALIAAHVKRPRDKVEAGLWTLLRLGAAQLALLGGVARHAAVHETVALAHRAGQPRWTGFANGVLRSISRTVTDEYGELPGADAVPIAEGRYRRLTSTIFPDPQRDWSGWFAAAFSFPDWLVNRWRQRYSPDELLQMGFWFNRRPPLTLRVNTLAGSREEYLELLAEAGIAAEAGGNSRAVLIRAGVSVPELPGFAEGRFSVQDEAAMAAAELLAPRPGDRVLDLCAAPGGKTTHLAELMENSGEITAADISDDRLARIEQNAGRLGLNIIRLQKIDPAGSDLPAGPFEAALVDAPCTNTGVLNKRAEARWRIGPDDITELAAIQTRLLHAACEAVVDGGRVVYSTCSLEPEENGDVVRAVLADRPDWRLISETSHLPGQPADGSYQALLQHEASASTGE